jgi:nicotinamidase-related amidase
MTESALIIIDVQQGMFFRSIPIYNADQILDNIAALVQRAHTASIPVVYVQHRNKTSFPEGSEKWQIHPRVQPSDLDLVIQKPHSSAFKKTTLQQELESRSIKTVVIMGLCTPGCVKNTCIDAKKLGYHVVLVEDGHSSAHKQAAEFIAKWNQRLQHDGIVELKSTREIDFQDLEVEN